MKEIEFFDLGYCDESEYTRVIYVNKKMLTYILFFYIISMLLEMEG